MHCEIRQNLTVHFDASQVQAVDEFGICQCFVMCTNSCVDTLDPQCAEITLTILTVTCCVLVCFINRLGRYLEGILATAVVAFRLLDDFLVTGVGYGTTFNAGHSSEFLSVRTACMI